LGSRSLNFPEFLYRLGIELVKLSALHPCRLYHQHPCAHFFQDPHDHSAAGRIMSMTNPFRVLSACSAVIQRTAPPRAPPQVKRFYCFRISHLTEKSKDITGTDRFVNVLPSAIPGIEDSRRMRPAAVSPGNCRLVEGP
jgi:hypothetical protein